MAAIGSARAPKRFTGEEFCATIACRGLTYGSGSKVPGGEEVADVLQVTKKDAEVIVNTWFDSIVESPQEGTKIELRGFDSFRLRNRAARIGRNPKTGEQVQVPAKRIPLFPARQGGPPQFGLMPKPQSHKWTFKARFRRHAFGWRSKPAIQRIREAVSEIKKTTRKDPLLAAEGAVTFLERLSPAIERVDSSSGVIGTAASRAIDQLVPIIAKAPADTAPGASQQTNSWLREAYQVVQAKASYGTLIFSECRSETEHRRNSLPARCSWGVSPYMENRPVGPVGQ